MTIEDYGPFELVSVVHLVRPSGHRAGNLEELRVGIEQSDAASLFYHTIQGPLRRPDSSSGGLPQDDFSAWANGVLQDREIAERLSFAVQGHGSSEAELRQALLEALASVSEKDRRERAAPAESALVFLTSESVRVPVGVSAHDADELVEALAEAGPDVWFHHLIEEPWYSGGAVPIARWARSLGETRLASLLEEESRAGRGLEEMRRRLARRWRQSRLHGRIAAASAATEDERREAGRAAVAGLVRRITRTGGGDDAGRGS